MMTKTNIVRAMRAIGILFAFAFAEIGSATAAPGVASSGDAAWQAAFDAAYAEANEEAVFRPSPLALRLAVAEGSSRWEGLPPDEGARQALVLAMNAERSLRFGVSAQEARIILRLGLRFADRGSGMGRFVKELSKSMRPDGGRGGAGDMGRRGTDGTQGKGKK